MNGYDASGGLMLLAFAIIFHGCMATTDYAPRPALEDREACNVQCGGFGRGVASIAYGCMCRVQESENHD